jgi:hypothetical protein
MSSAAIAWSSRVEHAFAASALVICLSEPAHDLWQTEVFTEGPMTVNAANLAEIDALFARADKDDDGQINYTEFRSLVRELDGDDMPDETLRIGFSETDSDGNGRINIDEFRTWWLSD